MFRVAHDDFHQFVDLSSKLERIATGFGFTEGPIWHPHDHYLLFSDIALSVQHQWTEAAGCSVFRTPSNQANGNAFDRNGFIVTCEHASSQVVRLEHSNKLVVPIATQFEGKRFNSPNDIVADDQNRLWFTDPSYGRTREDLGLIRESELDSQAVYCLHTDGRLVQVADNFQQPNGLCFSLDGTQLFVNDTPEFHIKVFDVNKETAELSNEKIWADISGEGEGGPDGMKVSNHGHILCNGPGGVHVLNDRGELLGVILTPEKSTNFTFGGPNHSDLFITASTSVYRIRLLTDGPAWF
jgi:gluconolactonase